MAPEMGLIGYGISQKGLLGYGYIFNFSLVYFNSIIILTYFAENLPAMNQMSARSSVREDGPASREVVQSYIATTAVYDFNVYEKRVLYNLVKLAQSQIQGVRLSENLYRVDHPWKDLVRIELPVSDFLISENDKHHARVKAALESLHRKTFQYRDGKVWECFSIIANPKIELGSARVSFYVNSKLWDVLLDFSRGFSRYDLGVAFSLGSPYSMRLYEMLCCQDGPMSYSIESLRRQFNLQDRYPANKDFIKKVIASAQRELDEKSPVTFSYQPLKDGRAFTSIMFIPVRQPKLVTADADFRQAVRRYGSSPVLSGEEYRTLRDIGFTDSGINANLRLFMDCQKQMDFPLELAVIKGRSRTKKNPCGWCIETLRGKLSDSTQI